MAPAGEVIDMRRLHVNGHGAGGLDTVDGELRAPSFVFGPKTWINWNSHLLARVSRPMSPIFPAPPTDSSPD